MQIICPACDTSYTLPPGKIGRAGRLVRCARCGNRWHAEPVDELRAFEAAPVPDDEAPDPAEWPAVPEETPPRAAPVREASPREPAAPPPAAPGNDEEPLPDAFAGTPDEGEAADWASAAPVPQARIEPVPQARAEPVRAAAPEPDEETEAEAGDLEDEDEAGEEEAVGAGAARSPVDDLDADPVERDPFVAALDEPPVAARAAGAGSGPAENTAASADRPVRKGVETITRRPQVRARPKKRTPQWPSLPRIDYRAAWAKSRTWLGVGLFLIALAVPATAVLMRNTIVASVPAMAGLYRTLGIDVNVRGLAFEKIETLRELDEGQPVLVVEGVVTNVSRETRAVPSVRLALRGDDMREIYAWSVDPKTLSLPPGGSLRFRTKLASPPDEARDVQLRFSERRHRQAVLP